MSIIKTIYNHLNFIKAIAILQNNTIAPTTLITLCSFIFVANVAVFVGSVRRDRKGIRVAKWIKIKLQERNHKVYFIDPMELDLPLTECIKKWIILLKNL